MSLSVYDSSVPVVIKALTALSAVLDKGAVHAAAKGTDEANYLTMRLVPDMLPLSAQVRIACDVPRRGTIAVLQAITPESLEGAESRDISLPTPRGDVLEFTGRDFLFSFVIANLHFHCTMTYALLRSAGVELGKADYIGGN
jgi:hypothetical protein